MRKAVQQLFGSGYVAKVELRGAEELGPEGAEFARRMMRRFGGQVDGTSVRFEGRDAEALRSRVQKLKVELSEALFNAGYEAHVVA
ncbi:hypothetical protein EON81_08600 [bacterium]|nr:MAG: hypothetical protein EON81_08600 [bacterium]